MFSVYEQINDEPKLLWEFYDLEAAVEYAKSCYEENKKVWVEFHGEPFFYPGLIF